MDIVVDFQAFKNNNNEFIIKECAVVDIDYSFIEHWVVAPPSDFYELTRERRKAAVRLGINHHGLGWTTEA